MSNNSGFVGFPKQCPEFFKALADNNDKLWFEAHREDYEKYVMEPSRAFVVAMGERLRKAIPRINADPKVNRSLFKIHRDTRFSKDKTPFKTNLGLWFWEGSLPRMESSGFYLHLEGNEFMLGTGLYIFPKEYLETYRQSVIDKKHGPALAKAITDCSKIKGCEIGGNRLKRVPRGYDPDHKYAEYLLYDGLFAGKSSTIPREFYSAKLVDYCFEVYKKQLPIHKWLMAMIERV